MTDAEKIREYVEAGIKRIEADERYHYEPANVVINAPLALEQLVMQTEMQVFKAVQKLLSTKELDGIRRLLDEHDQALCDRKHGDVAACHFVDDVRELLSVGPFERMREKIR